MTAGDVNKNKLVDKWVKNSRNVFHKCAILKKLSILIFCKIIWFDSLTGSAQTMRVYRAYILPSHFYWV